MEREKQIGYIKSFWPPKNEELSLPIKLGNISFLLFTVTHPLLEQMQWLGKDSLRISTANPY